MAAETTKSSIRTDRFDPRPCRIVLRDGRHLEGLLAVAQGQTLIRFLAQRLSFVNVTMANAEWLEPEPLEHLAVRLSQIAWVRSSDGQIPLKPIAAMPLAMPIEVRLEGGRVLVGRIDISFNERLSDLLDTEGPFLPLFAAVALDGEELGDVAINVDCIVSTRGLPGNADQRGTAGA